MEFQKINFQNAEEFEEFADEISEIVWKIWDTADPALTDEFVEFLKNNYAQFFKAAKFAEKLTWIPHWLGFLCIVICDYDLLQPRNYNSLARTIFEFGGTREY